MNSSKIKVFHIGGETQLPSSFDILLCTIGYEQRARFACDKLNLQGRYQGCLEFKENKVYSYHDNLLFFREKGFSIVSFSRLDINEYLRGIFIKEKKAGQGSLSICYDISSTSREIMANLLWIFNSFSSLYKISISLYCIYSHAEFCEPAADYGPIVWNGPVIPELSGWTCEPSQPLTAVFGLGYEPDLAIGVMDYLEPSSVWAFRPTGHDKRYDYFINANNKHFMELMSEDRIFRYDVKRPFDLFITLELFCTGMIIDYRLLLIPFGPKIFSLCAILIALQQHPRLAVWRVSSANKITAINRVPDGRIDSLKITFDSNDVSSESC